MNIYEKLQEARIRLQEMNIRKSGKNKFAGFSYYELSDFIPIVNKLFNELKLYSMFSINSDQLAVLEIINAESPEEQVVFTSPIAGVELKGCAEIQGIGAAHTYMKRYLYMNALEIVEHDALDATVGDDKIDYNKTIESVKDVKQLNNTYKFLIDNARDDSWKKPLMNKSDALHARFNKEANVFEMASA